MGCVRFNYIKFTKFPVPGVSYEASKYGYTISDEKHQAYNDTFANEENVALYIKPETVIEYIYARYPDFIPSIEKYNGLYFNGRWIDKS